MGTILVTLVFVGGLAFALWALADTLFGSRDRILEVMSGRMPSRLPQLRAARGRSITVRPVALRQPQRRAAA